VGLFPFHDDPVIVGARIRAAQHVEDVVHEILRADVQREACIDGRVGQHALLHHQLGPALLTLRRTFLGRLENELHRSGNVGLHGGENLGDAHQDRHVSIVAARVHHANFGAIEGALNGRCEGKLHPLGNRERIHVSAQQDDRSRLAALEKTDDSRMSDAGLHLDAERAEMIGDELRGAHLAVAELGVGVNVTTPRHDLGLDGSNPTLNLRRQDLHLRGGGNREDGKEQRKRADEILHLDSE
jgi:hypothetical protein